MIKASEHWEDEKNAGSACANVPLLHTSMWPVAEACKFCLNSHKDSPHIDFKLGDVI